MIENVISSAKDLDYKVLDELNSTDCEQSYAFKSYLNSLEMLAWHWFMIKKEKYHHRITSHDQLDVFINEIPRVTN
jgi:hypothetical protein